MEAARPTWLSLSPRPLSGSVRRLAIAPTMVTSSPARIQTVPSPITTSQCHRAQGSRSSRPGIRVSMTPAEKTGAAVAWGG